jgi:hypothetical protein
MEFLPVKAQKDKTRILLSAKSTELDITSTDPSYVPEFSQWLEPLDDYIKKYNHNIQI